MIVRLHLASEPDRVEHGVRLGWLFVSLSLLLMAGFFLYPAVESFTESEPVPHPAAKVAAETADIQPVEPARRPAAAPKKRIRTVWQATVPPKPILETAPQAPEGIRNRIEGVIPVEVTLKVGRDGRVVSAHAPVQYDGVRSYFAEQAVVAARQWRFRPARVGQEAVPSEWTVRFRFYRSGVQWN